MTVQSTVPLYFTVAWHGLDNAAGVREYDVQYRVEGGAWQDWQLDTTGTEARFVGRPETSYYFQIRAIDNVSNESGWVEAGPVTVSAVTKYYVHGGQKVAMRRGDEVYYLHGDHLGSTSLTTASAGNVVSEVRYLPYGEERWASGEAVTDFGFTSQRNEASFGLMDYNARYYSPTLGRFVSPDSLVPEPSSSGGFNRYQYARNNPLKYTDPSGHFVLTAAVAILGGAAIGAGVGAGINYGGQVIRNVREKGMSFADATSFENIDGGQIVQAAVTGGVMGATMAIPGAAGVTLTTGATVALGTVGGVAAGQTGTLAHGAYDEAYDGDGEFNVSGMLDTAYEEGFGDSTKMIVDGAVGGVTSGVAARIFSGPPPPKPLHSSGQIPGVQLPVTVGGRTVATGGTVATGRGPLSFAPELSAGPSAGLEVARRVTGPASRGIITPRVNEGVEPLKPSIEEHIH